MAIYTPGNEPDLIKIRLRNFFVKLEEYYPDKLVVGIHNDHKHLGERLTELYRELGYESGEEFLNAYGYKYGSKPKTRTAVPREELIRKTEDLFRQIRDHYPNGIKTMQQIESEHPELKKTIASVNKYLTAKGTTVRSELVKRGLFVVKNDTPKTVKGRPVNYDKVMKDGIKKLKTEIYSVCKYPKMYCSIDDVKQENEDIKSIVESIEEAAKNLNITDEELISKFEEEGFIGEPAKKFKAEGLTPTDISYFEIDAKGKLISCSLGEKYSYNDTHEISADELVDVVIPPGVTSIKASAFENLYCLRFVYVPDGVKSLGRAVFRGCISLESVRLPDDLTQIPERAFRNCRSLRSMKLPETILSVREAVFKGCKNLEEVIFPSGMEIIGDEVFDECPNLKRITAPEKIVSEIEKFFSDYDIDLDIEYNGRRFSLPSEKDVLENFYQFAFSESTSYEPKKYLLCFDLYERFQWYELLDHSFEIIGRPNVSKFDNALKESVQDTAYCYGEEEYNEWLYDLSEIGYDASFFRASYEVMIYNASDMTRKLFKKVLKERSVKNGVIYSVPDGVTTIDELLSEIRTARAFDKDFEIYINVYSGRYSNYFKGYSFCVKKGMYYPRTIYLNDFL